MPMYGSPMTYPVMAPDALGASPAAGLIAIDVLDLFASMSGDCELLASLSGDLEASASASADLDLDATEG